MVWRRQLLVFQFLIFPLLLPPSSLPSGLLFSFPSSLARRQGANQQQLHNTQVCLKMKTRECAKICPRVWPIPRLSMCVAVLLHQCPCAPCDTLMYMWGHYPISGDTGQNVSMAHHGLGNKVTCRSTYKLVSTGESLGSSSLPMPAWDTSYSLDSRNYSMHGNNLVS